MTRQCIRCGASFDDRDVADKILTETEKSSCPNCREKAWSHTQKRPSGGWLQRLFGRWTSR